MSTPVLPTPDGTVRLLDVPPGLPLGVGGVDFTTTEVTLPLGSVLVLYTDGLVESRSSDIDARLTELTELLAAPVPSLPALCDRLLTHLVPASADDDIALLAARVGTAT
ncbi:PP2C family protein-serine/threonine phosphatase [Streptomyces sp. adm13(2018)]|uniref:PP2C family protein-serine/threonine phosphatase n=1 Tax=Streptomyces sp. adm13(2018) TaxID=2479007 RepID=UPI001C9C2715|nr:PP2C family protein-serine/threonine phosphatase [Streptomyces sp. adm13(2018)]